MALVLNDTRSGEEGSLLLLIGKEKDHGKANSNKISTLGGGELTNYVDCSL